MTPHSFKAIPVFLFFVLSPLSAQQSSRAVVFDGQTGYLEVPYSPMYNSIDHCTVELWARVDRGNGEFRAPLSMRDLHTGMNIYASNFNNWQLWIGIGTSWAVIEGPPIVLNEWTHLAATFDHGKVSFYVNGILAGTTTRVIIPNTTRPLRIGRIADETNGFFPGAVDDLVIRNNVLTEDEIIHSMMTGIRNDDGHIIAHWDLDEAAGNIFRDRSGNGLNAAAIGGMKRITAVHPEKFPLLSVDKTEIDFHDIPSGRISADSFMVSNRGTVTLHAKISLLNGDRFSLNLSSLTLKPNETHSIVVSVDPALQRKIYADIGVEHDGPGGRTMLHCSASSGLPEIDSVQTDAGAGTITILGKNFFSSTLPKVSIGSARATVRNAGERNITVSLPQGISYSPVAVSLSSVSALSPALFVPPAEKERSIEESSFHFAGTIVLKESSAAFAVHDMDGDGLPDAVVLDRERGRISIVSHLTFSPENTSSAAMRRVNYPVGVQPEKMFIADCNNDGLDDIIVTNGGSKDVYIYRNVSSPGSVGLHLDQKIPTEALPSSIAVGDIDLDGRPDLAILMTLKQRVLLFNNRSSIPGGGTILFDSAGYCDTQIFPQQIVITDLNGDKRPDIAVSGNYEVVLSLLQNKTTYRRFKFECAQRIHGGDRVSAFAAADVNLDGKTDLVLVNRETNTFSVYKNISSSDLPQMAARVDFRTGADPFDISFNDLDGDGKPDAVVANNGGSSFSIFKNEWDESSPGTILFSPKKDIPLDGPAVAVASIDIDLDGRADILTQTAAQPGIQVYVHHTSMQAFSFWFTWIGSGIVLIGGFFWSIRYVELRKIRRRIALLEDQQRTQEEFSRKMIESQETERKRLAKELHDALGQNLLVIKNVAMLGLKRTEQQRSPDEQLQEISDTAMQAIEEVRSLTRALHPYQLDRLGLTKAVVAMVENLAHSTQIEFETSIDTVDHLLPKEAEIHLYRIVQESLSNAIKHSGTVKGIVIVKNLSTEILCTIRDFGKGFNSAQPHSADAPGGLGLTGIGERVRMLGGTFQVDSVPDNGTTVTVRIPLKG